MDLTGLEKNLGIKFKNRNLISCALTHRSYLNEAPSKNLTSNERLEFLGDAVLSLIVSRFLYKKFAGAPEGQLTSLRASLVNSRTLSEISQNLKLGKYLLLSRGEEESGGRKNPGILADAFEALIGAIFIEKGLASTTDFVSCHLIPVLQEIIKQNALKDFKSLLQEHVQAFEKISPTYRVLKTLGPDHDKIFTVGVYSGSKKMGIGDGHSKQEAEQEAAKSALEKLGLLK